MTALLTLEYRFIKGNEEGSGEGIIARNSKLNFLSYPTRR